MDIRQPSSWFDFGSLAELKAKGGARPEEATKSVAQQFESLFLNIMLKEMRKTVNRSGLLGSDTMETYEQMFDQQIALGMSKAGGIGLAPFIEQQLNKNAPVTPKTDKVPFTLSTDVALKQRGFDIERR
jgi:flagellar protein FlgJ